MKSENNRDCIYCGSEKVIKYGRHHDKQRFFCKICKKSFSADTTVEKLKRSEREVLSLLISFIEGNVEDKKMLELFRTVQKNIKASQLNNIKFEEIKYKKQTQKVPIRCAYPQILICKAPDSDKIQIFKLPEYAFEENTPSQEIILRIYNSDKNIDI